MTTHHGKPWVGALRRAKLLFAASALFGAVAAPAFADSDATQHFAIESQTLSSALRAYAEQTGDQVVFFSEIGRNQLSNEVVGNFTSDAALSRMLAKTGLTFERLDSHTIAIASAKHTSAGDSPRWSKTSLAADGAPIVRLAEASSDSAAPTEHASDKATHKVSNDASDLSLNEIVVTGTHIRGETPAGSSLKVYSREDLAQSGAGTVDQFARQMVENFSGADTVANPNTNIGYSRFNGGGLNNAFQGASFDLHGLGPTATLTLMNGHRLAGGGYDGSLVDMSQIPLSAVDHIEVLADGASAIYGADAVAGVVNIVTRKDFQGVETGLRYGAATAGGAGEFTGSQLVGTSWTTGNVLLNYEFDKQDGLEAADRSYLPNQGGADLLVPRNRRNSVLLSVNQGIGDTTTLSVDGIYSDREYHTHTYLNSSVYAGRMVASGNSRLAGITAAIDQAMWSDWHASLTAEYSKLRQLNDALNRVFAGSMILQDADALTDVHSDVLDADLLVTGSLFSLPAGAVKAAMGASYRRETFESTTGYTINGAVSAYGVPSLQRHVSSVYGEVAIPLIDTANATAWTQRLLISAAGRYDDYSDFGSTTNPKVGLVWEPVTGFSLRSTYGKSYRAPLLNQIGSPLTASALLLPNPNSPSGASDTIILNGGNPGLRAERSTSYTAGFDLKIPTVPNFTLSATYFHILFRDRIAIPPAAGGNYLGDPAVASFLTLNPPLTLVQSYFNTPGFFDSRRLGPGAVTAIFDNRQANIATSKQSGVDLTAAYMCCPRTMGNSAFPRALRGWSNTPFRPRPPYLGSIWPTRTANRPAGRGAAPYAGVNRA